MTASVEELTGFLGDENIFINSIWSPFFIDANQGDLEIRAAEEIE